MSCVLGIDIGGTKIAGALVSLDGEVLASARQPTEAHRGRDHVLDVAKSVAASLLARRDDTRAIGIGSGGQIDSNLGVVVSATDILPGWSGTDLRGEFEREFDLSVAVDNDVNALAVGEYRFGAARGSRTAVFAALGTGVGGALLIGGMLHGGAHWSAGEIGHLLIDIAPDARRDAGGARGTLEAYCSGAGLARTWREISGSGDHARSAREIAAEAACEPDGFAAQSIRRTGEYLGYGLVSVANLIDPDIIVIGGGLASLGEQLLAPAREILKVRALPGPAQCPVERASLGDDASVIGAASLAMDLPDLDEVDEYPGPSRP